MRALATIGGLIMEAVSDFTKRQLERMPFKRATTPIKA